MSNARLEELIAKQEIFELSARYMRGLDRLDGALQRTVFHDDATTDYGFFKGNADDFVAFAQRALASHLANHHMLGQALIEIDGDVAHGEVYFQAFHRIIEDGAEKDLIISGRYVDRYERRDGVWKIAARAEVNDWSRTDPAADDFFRQVPGALRGARGAADLSSRG
jgi:hypothetical protein